MRYLPEDIVNYASVVTYNSSKEEDYPNDLVKGKIFVLAGKELPGAVSRC